MLRPSDRFAGLATLVVALAVATVHAQQAPTEGASGPGGARGLRPRDPLNFSAGGLLPGLLASQQVQEELKLTDAQEEKLRDYASQVREAIRKQAEGLRERRQRAGGSSEEEHREVLAMAEKWQADIREKLSEILDPVQFKRFKEIELQVELQRQDVRPLARADIAQALGLSDKQKRELQQVVAEMDKKGDDLREQSPGVFRLFAPGARDLSDEARAKLREQWEQFRQKRQEILNEAKKKAMAVLTDEQKAKLADLKGKPFELRRAERRPRSEP
jgi:Spy/CpxP family protein refolding chaperone